MFNRKCKVLLINHGSTIYSEQNRLYDLDDYPPINENGRIEIEKAGSWLKTTGQHADLIYTSSALRTIQSARIVSKYLKKDIEIIDNLHERRAGIWSGLTQDQIELKYPNMLKQHYLNPCTFCIEGEEPVDELNKRVQKSIKEIVKQNINGRIILITHSTIIQSAIATAIGLPPSCLSRIYVPNGSITQINYYKDWSSLVFCSYLPL